MSYIKVSYESGLSLGFDDAKLRIFTGSAFVKVIKFPTEGPVPALAGFHVINRLVYYPFVDPAVCDLHILKNKVASIATPCSVNAYGSFLTPPYSFQLEVPIWDFKYKYSSRFN